MLLTLFLATIVAPQQPSAPDRVAARAPAATAAQAATKYAAPTRDDFTRALLRFDRAWTRHPPEPERVLEINWRFDRALAASATTPNDALREIDDLAWELDPSAPRDLLALRPEFDPPVGPLFQSGPTGFVLHIRLTPLYRSSAPSKGPRLFQAQLRSPSENGVVVAETWRDGWSLEAGPIELDARFENSVSRAYILTVATNEKPFELLVATWHRLEEPTDTVREKLVRGAASLQPTSPELDAALHAFRSRVGQLVDRPVIGSDSFGAQSTDRLARLLGRELESLTESRDPYRRKELNRPSSPGDRWRTVQVGDAPLPVRVLELDLSSEGAARPLVIALHARGGDENVFFESFGIGKLVELATEKGFLVAAPRVGESGLSGEAFDALVTELGYCYAIDPTRIYVLGHAEGATAALELARARRERIAAVACFAGGAPIERTLPPTHVWLGAVDTAVDAVELGSVLSNSRASGAPIEHEVVDDHGHTLVVHARLPQAIDWLLAHHLGANESK